MNDGMPLHMVDLTVEALQEVGVDIAEARVAVLGYAYLENSDDTRNSPSKTLVARLRELGAEVVIHDPYVPGYQGDLAKVTRGCDAAVVMVKHDVYREVDLEQLGLARPVLVDGRRVFDATQAQTVEFVRSVGQG